MTKIYYVCNRTDKLEIQFSSLAAAKQGWELIVCNMIDKIISMFPDMHYNVAQAAANDLFYVKQVEYVRAEVVYWASDLKEMKDE